MDLAIGTAEREAAFFCLSVVAFDKGGIRWIIAMNRHRGITLKSQLDILGQVYKDMDFEVCGVESNGIQAAIEGYVRETTMIPTRPIHTGALQKTDIEIGIPSLATEWEQGRWRIPYGDARSRRLVDPMLEELFAYPSPGSHFDTIMSIFFAWSMQRQGPRGTPSIIGINF